jgi:phage host-nuclease inhibitor protein Gam
MMPALSRRVTLLEEDAKGEKRVSRHILRKLNDVERLVLDMKREMADVKREMAGEMTDVRKEISGLRDEIALMCGEITETIATAFGAIMREALAKVRKED